MKKVFLFEDHHKSLEIWQDEKIHGLDLIHIDAHMDFNPYKAKPLRQVFEQADNIRELKYNLECSLAFMRFQKDFNKQTNIGNYIYPAILDGIVRNFYWVIPGDCEELKKSSVYLKQMLKKMAQDTGSGSAVKVFFRNGIISAEIMGRNFYICVLDTLPDFKKQVLLDIDTDFFVIDSIRDALSVDKIGKRRRWMNIESFMDVINAKIKKPKVVTIAYSVNGGYTPIIYKHIGDELAYSFSPEKFRRKFNKNLKAAEFFDLFYRTGRKEYYKKAISFNSLYRAADNSFGPLYMSLRKFARAEAEFLRIYKADPRNPGILYGLGKIALQKKHYKKAGKYFNKVLSSKKQRLFEVQRRDSLMQLAYAEFHLKRYKEAYRLLLLYKRWMPLDGRPHYISGEIEAKTGDFESAVKSYKSAIMLGFDVISTLSALLKIAVHIKEKDDIMQYISFKFAELKKKSIGEKNRNIRRNMKNRLEKRISVFEKKLLRRLR